MKIQTSYLSVLSVLLVLALALSSCSANPTSAPALGGEDLGLSTSQTTSPVSNKPSSVTEPTPVLIPSPSAIPTPTTIPTPAPIPTTTQFNLPPTAPIDLNAEPSRTTINLRWSDRSQNEDGFKIYRDNILIATISRNVNAYQDTKLQQRHSYNYALIAFNIAGDSESCRISTKTLGPPLNVTVNYIGVKRDRDPGGGEIKLIVIISDGVQMQERYLPEQAEGAHYDLHDFSTVQVNQRVFTTSEGGDYLKIVVVAGEEDPGNLLPNIITAGSSVLGLVLAKPLIGDIGSAIAPLFTNENDYIGSYQWFWTADENWGVGQHYVVVDDLGIWFSVWSDNPPPDIPKPSIKPQIIIESVDLPAQVVVGKTYSRNVKLRNNEAIDLVVTLKELSSLSSTGEASSKVLTVPSKGNIDVTFSSAFKPSGVRTMTYTLLYRDTEIATVSKTVEAKNPRVTIESVDLPAQVVIGRTYSYVTRLRNSETYAIAVTIKSLSSLTNTGSSFEVIVPAGSYKDVTFTSSFSPAGVRTMTFTVLHEGGEIAILSKTVEAK